MFLEFIKVEPDESDLRKKSLAPSTSQFESMYKRSRTDLTDSRRPNKWSPNTAGSAKEASLNTWSESDVRSQPYAYQNSNETARLRYILCCC